MRIVHLTTVHARNDVRIFHKECASLAAEGYDVHLIVSDGKGDGRQGDVTVHDVGAARGRLGRMLMLPWRAFGCARKLNARLYHFHDPELIPVGLLLRWGGAEVIYDSHEDVPRAVLSKSWIRPWLRRLVARTFEVLEDFAAKRFSSVIGATPHIASRFRILNSRSVDINNYPLEQELGAPCAESEPSRNVCYVGGIGKIRGAVEMVRALESVNARLILAGPFESSETEREVRALPGWSKVDYRGVVSRPEVREILGASMAGLVFFHPEPNHIDAQPNKIFEYMSAGLPVLASDFPLWASLLEGTGAGLCADPLDPAAIAGLIRDVVASPAAAREMGARGRAAVQQRYRWSQEAKKLAQLYRDILGDDAAAHLVQGTK